MTKIEKLHDIACKADIEIHDIGFSKTKKGACLCSGEHKNILLDKKRIDSVSEETEILAEEIGHYETGSLYILDAAINSSIGRSNRIKYEVKGRQWAYAKLAPPGAIQENILKCTDESELAETLDITVSFLQQAINYYQTIGIEFIFPQ